MTLKLSSNSIDRYNNETNFPPTDKGIANLCKAFANSSTNMKLSKTQISKTIQSS